MFTFTTLILNIKNMDWHERFKEMKKRLGYSNSDIAEITGNTTDSIKSSTQPNKDIPRWLKLAIVISENNSNGLETVKILKGKPEGYIQDFIREKLQFNEELLSQLQRVDLKNKQNLHRRFDMSGYETTKGTQAKIVNSILQEFAYLGIYDYTKYLNLDFYKGQGTLYLRYFNSDLNEEFNLGGYGTVEIIYEIFKKTILSDKKTRRRI